MIATPEQFEALFKQQFTSQARQRISFPISRQFFPVIAD
jgi:hypothetical protein